MCRSIKKRGLQLSARSEMSDYSCKYTKIKKKSRLGSGGNGDVSIVIKKDDGKKYALKELNRDAQNNQEKLLRFHDEIDTMVTAGPQIEGIIPILEYSKEGNWYVMPIAESIEKHIDTIDDIIEGICQICATLIELHRMGLSHRDIKPANMLYYNNRWVLCDFGLVDIPDNPHGLTKDSSRIGAVRTLPPEMSRSAKTADGKKADVYSLAKSLWILLTGEKTGYEGHYDVTDKSISLHSIKKLKNEHLVEIDELFDLATNNAPEDRPDMSIFKQYLTRWKSVKSDFASQQISTWSFLNKYLFKEMKVQRCMWEDPAEAVYVLSLLSLFPVYSHIFFPDHGWLEFEKVERGTEENSLDFKTTFGVFRIRLQTLIYENFSDSPQWSYFLLETGSLPVVVGDQMNKYREVVVEDIPGHFVSAKDAEYGVYDYETGRKLPSGYKIINRYLEGKFLIVPKAGPYNHILTTDDGRHSRCSAEEFREHIKNLQRDSVSKSIETGENTFSRSPAQRLQDSDTSKTANRAPDYMFMFEFSAIVDGVKTSSKGKVCYRYVFEANGVESVFSLFEKRRIFLCKDGKLKRENDPSCCFFEVTGRETAMSILKDLNMVLASYFSDDSSCLDDPSFSVEIIKRDSPSHLFTKQRIRQIMKDADDRNMNILVIDEDGEAQIVNDVEEARFYPVRYEAWCERNSYVGKYSTLSDLDNAFQYCLCKWRDYLVDGRGQPLEPDFYDDTSEEELIREIKEMTFIES